MNHFLNNYYIFQDDNAPVHRARIVQEYKLTNIIPDIFWPAQSPNAGIIENIWFLEKKTLNADFPISITLMILREIYMISGYPL